MHPCQVWAHSDRLQLARSLNTPSLPLVEPVYVPRSTRAALGTATSSRLTSPASPLLPVNTHNTDTIHDAPNPRPPASLLPGPGSRHRLPPLSRPLLHLLRPPDLHPAHLHLSNSALRLHRNLSHPNTPHLQRCLLALAIQPVPVPGVSQRCRATGAPGSRGGRGARGAAGAWRGE